jgi:hypothetical protein
MGTRYFFRISKSIIFVDIINFYMATLCRRKTPQSDVPWELRRIRPLKFRLIIHRCDDPVDPDPAAKPEEPSDSGRRA